jgi:hypothetical protein
MDWTTCTSDQLAEIAEGFRAARDGFPLDLNQSRLWQEGWIFWEISRPEREAALDAIRTLH